MEEKIQGRASVGSKLPKFGALKPPGSFLPNGTHVSLSGKSNISNRDNKHSETDRSSNFSLNWKKINTAQNDHNVTESAVDKGPDTKIYTQVTADKHPPRSGLPPKSGKKNTMVVSQKEDLNENILSGLSTSTKFTKSVPLGRTSYSGLNGCQTQLNGFYSSRPSLGLQRPRANSATSRNFSNKVLTSSNDNSKTFSYVRRSQSFSHSIQNSLHQPTPLTRSHSFNREVDLAKSYENVQNVRTTPKSHLLSRSERQYNLSNGNPQQAKSGFTRTFSAGSASGLKKPGLPNGSVVNNIPLTYKMSRPSLLKSNRSQFPREIIIDGDKSSLVSSVTEKPEPISNGTGGPSHKPTNEKKTVMDQSPYILCDTLEKQDPKDDYFGEDIDELSISSLSSSDKNDLSEDFSDDFVDLEDGNKTILEVEPEKDVSDNLSTELLLGSLPDSKTRITDKTKDWIGMNITVQSALESTDSSFGDNRISPDMEYRDPSSLELSPSDSSGGTYMWDEEGMEPIGTVHPCGSYESSEMNSLDILNNLDSCDLEDDDLMLDVDLPEDAPCEIGKGENMSHFERTDRNLRQHQQGFWKRPPQRLFGQEQYHLSNADHYLHGRTSACLESPTDYRESFGSPNFFSQTPRAPQIMGLRDNTVMLDEMTLRHMVQDCTAVKTQLLKLKRLLQQEDDCGSLQDLQLSVPTTPEPQDPEPLFKTEDLLNEIRQLKEDSKKKDETIKQLEHQLKSRCKCQDPKGEKPSHHDKYTQTSWRRSSPQVLQCSNNIPSTTDPSSGKLIIKQPHIEGQSEPEKEIQQPLSCCFNGDVGNVVPTIPETELSLLLNKKLKIKDLEDNLREVKKAKELASSPGPLINNGGFTHQTVTSALPSLSVGPKSDLQSKLTPKTSSTGHVPRPKTLQLYKPKTHTTSAHQDPTNSLTTSKDLQARTTALSSSLEQKSNGSQSVVQKSQRLSHDGIVGEPDAQVPSKSFSFSPKPMGAIKDKASSSLIKPDTRPIHPSPPSTGISKPTGALSSDSSKQTNRQTTMLRPPSNFASKLKKASSPKSESLHPSVVAQEPTKSPIKTSSSNLTKPLSQKSSLDTTEIPSPKRLSRLPQPKTH
ncbi:serine-rich coiled-coil domain-containing protein 2 isoform 2-T2 [Discoglossus pictus]